jgi:hypothetical protein
MICILFYVKIDEDMMTGHMRQNTNAYRVLVGKPQ